MSRRAIGQGAKQLLAAILKQPPKVKSTPTPAHNAAKRTATKRRGRAVQTRTTALLKILPSTTRYAASSVPSVVSDPSTDFTFLPGANGSHLCMRLHATAGYVNYNGLSVTAPTGRPVLSYGMTSLTSGTASSPNWLNHVYSSTTILPDLSWCPLNPRLFSISASPAYAMCNTFGKFRFRGGKITVTYHALTATSSTCSLAFLYAGDPSVAIATVPSQSSIQRFPLCVATAAWDTKSFEIDVGDEQYLMFTDPNATTQQDMNTQNRLAMPGILGLAIIGEPQPTTFGDQQTPVGLVTIDADIDLYDPQADEASYGLTKARAAPPPTPEEYQVVVPGAAAPTSTSSAFSSMLPAGLTTLRK